MCNHIPAEQDVMDQRDMNVIIMDWKHRVQWQMPKLTHLSLNSTCSTRGMAKCAMLLDTLTLTVQGVPQIYHFLPSVCITGAPIYIGYHSLLVMLLNPSTRETEMSFKIESTDDFMYANHSITRTSNALSAINPSTKETHKINASRGNNGGKYTKICRIVTKSKESICMHMIYQNEPWTYPLIHVTWLTTWEGVGGTGLE